MKKLLYVIALVLFFIPNVAHAQLKVDAEGHVKINGNNDLNVPLSITSNINKNDEGLLRLNISDSNKSSFFGLQANIRTNHASSTIKGIDAIASTSYSQSSSRVYGLRGRASGSSQGMNYGVFGSVPAGGAAIYGTTASSYIGIRLYDNSYAGFFDGSVKVTQDLTVAGYINGIVVGNGTSGISQLNRNRNTNASLSDVFHKLSGLTANPYFLEMPEHATVGKKPSSTSGATDAEVDEETLIREDDGDYQLSEMEIQVLNKQHFGLDVEQLEKTFPDLVYTCKDGEKRINYVEMVPILVQAVNELSAKVEALEVNNGKDRQNKLTTSVDSTGDGMIATLGQNIPNPFSTTSIINATLPESILKAAINIYDLNGTKVKQVDVTQRGLVKVELTATDLASGMYLYSLIADGKVIETRRMIVE